MVRSGRLTFEKRRFVWMESLSVRTALRNVRSLVRRRRIGSGAGRSSEMTV